MEVESDTVIELASQLGLAAERVFDIFVTAQPITAIISFCLLVGVVICTIFTYKYVNSHIKEDVYDRMNVIYAITGAMFVIYVISSLIIYSILTAILIPEYTAARELIYLLKS